jgi:hypothetical protein
MLNLWCKSDRWTIKIYFLCEVIFLQEVKLLHVNILFSVSISATIHDLIYKPLTNTSLSHKNSHLNFQNYLVFKHMIM